VYNREIKGWTGITAVGALIRSQMRYIGLGIDEIMLATYAAYSIGGVLRHLGANIVGLQAKVESLCDGIRGKAGYQWVITIQDKSGFFGKFSNHLFEGKC
jgi:hypothetical protein